MCRAHCNWKMVLAAPCFLQGAPGLHGVAVIVRDDLTTEPPRSLPARFRPRSFRDRGLVRLYRLDIGSAGKSMGRVGKQVMNE